MNTLAGTPVLLRLALRRDRIVLPAWVYVLAASVVSTAVSFRSLYDTEDARLRFAAGIAANTSLRALYGPLHDASTIGGLTAWRMGVFGAVLAGLMSTLLVVRHTRAEEEDGRLELVGAGAVGRRAPLTAALLAAATANLVLAALVAGCLAATGEAPAGSLAFGLALGGCGMLFAGTAAVTAQVAGTARAANGLAGALLGTAFVLRAVGDAGPAWVGWLSPIGWAEQVRPFAGDRWWALLLPAAGTALAVAAAYALVARRDLGAGLLPQRPGPAAGAPGLRTATALAVRLHRGTLIGWAGGLAAAGLVFGGVSRGVVDLVGDNARVADVIARLGGRQGVLDAYFGTMTNLFGMVVAGYAVQAVLRLRAEETSGRAEPVLATAVSRLRWAGGHLLFPLAGSAVLLAVAGVFTGLGQGAAMGGTGRAVARLVPAALAQLPAVWLVAAVALAVVGLAPRWSTAAWGALAFFLLIGWLGPVLRLPQWALDLSPFTHTPHLPGGAFTAVPLLWLTALAAVAAAVGLAALDRRDLG
ncbi:ABC transporter permease [Kitasatospora sp. NPDC007106]|uniref:ABC transporter permease n=1 Tax=Kitasatospora sp. NPDC007106 TaxID=3156914 RepID=UPI00340A2EF8